jgi:hypothetical protein
MVTIVDVAKAEGVAPSIRTLGYRPRGRTGVLALADALIVLDVAAADPRLPLDRPAMLVGMPEPGPPRHDSASTAS